MIQGIQARYYSCEGRPNLRISKGNFEMHVFVFTMRNVANDFFSIKAFVEVTLGICLFCKQNLHIQFVVQRSKCNPIDYCHQMVERNVKQKLNEV